MSNGKDASRERILFVSDVHLTPELPEVLASFCQFLETEAAGAKALYVLGDLFDYWVGAGQAHRPGWEEVLSDFSRLAGGGTRLYFLPGNRDFLFDAPLATGLGFTMLPDVERRRMGNRRVLLTHGDLLMTRDHRYLRMRRILRRPGMGRLLRAIPFSLALRIAHGFRRASTAEIARKSSWTLAPDWEEAVRWMGSDVDLFVFGHAHLGEHRRIRRAGREVEIVVLPAWDLVPGYLRLMADRIDLLPWPPGKQSKSLVAPGPSGYGGRLRSKTRRVIAIDGPAGSGKSTVARRVADALDFRYLDSGAMYRALALKALRQGVAGEDEEALTRLLDEAGIELVGKQVLLDGEDVSREIRSADVTRFVSRVATVAGVRAGMVEKQRAVYPGEDLVVEGRDIGSVVFPDADLKVFLTASEATRARRRASETGRDVAEILEEQRVRDELDATRTHSPLVQTADAFVLDTTGLSVDQVVAKLVRRIEPELSR